MSAVEKERAAYLIVLKQVLIARDLAETIAEHDPGARVVLAQTCAEALRLLDAVPEKVVLSFLSVSPENISGSALVNALSARGSRTVLMGDDAENRGEAPGWWVLERPFTSEMVTNLLRRTLTPQGTGLA